MSSYRFVLPAFLIICAVSAVADEGLRTVSVTGIAGVTVRPDRARINMAIQARNIDMGAARQRVVDVTRKFLTLCDQLGLNRDHVRTTGLTIRPEYRWDRQGLEQELTGYLVQRQLDLELQDLDLLGDVLEGAVDAGVNQVSPPRLDTSQRRELYREALAAAAEDARSNARALATSLGTELGAVRQLNAQDMAIPRPEVFGARAMVAEAGVGATYETGEIRIEARVNASFDLLVN